MTHTWNVTYEIVTDASAAEGDAAERGFVAEGVSFREAWSLWSQIGGHVEADTCPVSLRWPPRWLTTYGDANYREGTTESRGLHFPDHITASSRLRVARLARCYGVERKGRR